VCHRHGAGIQLRRDRKLAERSVPLAHDHQELSEEYATLEIRRVSAHLSLQFHQASGNVAGAQLAFRGTHCELRRQRPIQRFSI
jgi:hypothetical protein